MNRPRSHSGHRPPAARHGPAKPSVPMSTTTLRNPPTRAPPSTEFRLQVFRLRRNEFIARRHELVGVDRVHSGARRSASGCRGIRPVGLHRRAAWRHLESTTDYDFVDAGFHCTPPLSMETSENTDKMGTF